MLPEGLQTPGARSSITFSKLLVVEGHSAFQFFKALLRHMNLLEEIEIRNSGGVDELSTYLEGLVITSGFDKVKSVGVVRDAETDASAAFQSVCQSLERADLSVPDQPAMVAEGTPRVSVFILPDCSSSGMLETLCLQSVEDDPATSCVYEYFQCLKGMNVEYSHVRLPKAHLHAFLASKPKPDLLLGQAAHEGYWPWDNSAFNFLKQFLQTL